VSVSVHHAPQGGIPDHNGSQRAKALEQFKSAKFDLVITDIRMSGMDGIELLAELKKIDQTIPVIIMTAYASQKSAIEAVNHGAFHYLIKQRRTRRSGSSCERPRHEARPGGEHDPAKRAQENRRLEDDLGKSEEMDKVFKLVEKVAETTAPSSFFGESGTGKELIAREIHFKSNRVNNPS